MPIASLNGDKNWPCSSSNYASASMDRLPLAPCVTAQTKTRCQTPPSNAPITRSIKPSMKPSNCWPLKSPKMRDFFTNFGTVESNARDPMGFVHSPMPELGAKESRCIQVQLDFEIGHDVLEEQLDAFEAQVMAGLQNAE